MAKPLRRFSLIVLLSQVFSLLRLLNDRSTVHVVHGRAIKIFNAFSVSGKKVFASFRISTTV